MGATWSPDTIATVKAMRELSAAEWAAGAEAREAAHYAHDRNNCQHGVWPDRTLEYTALAFTCHACGQEVHG